MTYIEYIENIVGLKEELLFCERTDPRFKEKREFPGVTPEQYSFPEAKRYDYSPKKDKRKLLEGLRNNAGKHYWNDDEILDLTS
jgi:hypothetical protein